MYIIVYQPDQDTSEGRKVFGPFQTHEQAYQYMCNHKLPITNNGARYIEELTQV